ncbi:hypothetical protein DWQ65_02715 [Treponema phagedenis]|uniref:Uncharacterized protein n=1 Tax=Treponema phagedenis TaxID=162 RepID=A0A0B7H1P5_TREPH|nr:hypothetical protein C5O78_12790 [Treponema phagedenis]QSH99007.1 hypothetical protein DWQ65_02715 [Treponema phagedenis]CEM63150.1 conserved hypothetical protein [Treponema phagedenis]
MSSVFYVFFMFAIITLVYVHKIYRKRSFIAIFKLRVLFFIISPFFYILTLLDHEGFLWYAYIRCFLNIEVKQ